jgi:hypothetical protein
MHVAHAFDSLPIDCVTCEDVKNGFKFGTRLTNLLLQHSLGKAKQNHRGHSVHPSSASGNLTEVSYVRFACNTRQGKAGFQFKRNPARRRRLRTSSLKGGCSVALLRCSQPT